MKHLTTFLLLFSIFSAHISAQAPFNDICADAADLSALLGQGIGQKQTTDSYSNVDATGEPELAEGLEGYWFDADADGNDVSVDQSVWFRMEGDGNTYQFMTINCSGAALYSDDTQMALYRGNCNALTLVAANDDLQPFWDVNYGWYYSWTDAKLDEGETYFLMVDGYNWNDGDNFQGVAQGSFCLTVMQTTNMGEHNACSGALGIDDIFEPSGAGLSFVGPFDNTPEGSGIVPNPNAETLGTECWEDGPTEDGSVWFKFTGDGNSYTITHTYCDDDNLAYMFAWDSQMALYTGSCGELVPVGCFEDFDTDNNGFWSEVGFDSEEGEEYFLRFDGFHWTNNGAEWTADGAFCLQAFDGNVNAVESLEVVAMDAFPNPTSNGRITLSWPGSDAVADIAVFDIKGRRIIGLRQVVRESTLDLDLPAGSYVLKMRSASTTSSTTIQVIR